MEEIVERAKKGDKDAFVEIINVNRLSMYRVAKSYLKCDEDVADVISEAIITAYEKINQLKESKYFNTWLIRILINKCNYYIKKNKKYIYMEGTELENAVNDKTVYSEKNYTEEQFYALIDDLPEKYKIVLILYYGEGFSIKEISKILDLSENTIKTRLKRARDKISDRKSSNISGKGGALYEK